MKIKGFTLIELMIVVSILGILAAIVVPHLQDHSVTAKEVAAQDSLHIIRGQIEMYKLEHNDLAPGYWMSGAQQASTTMLTNQFVGISNETGYAAAGNVPTSAYPYGPYLSDMPVNPFNGKSTMAYAVYSAGTKADFETALGIVDETLIGWLYQKETATIRLCKSGTDSQGKSYLDY